MEDATEVEKRRNALDSKANDPNHAAEGMMNKLPLVLCLCLLRSLSATAQPILFVTGEWEPFSGAALPNHGIAAEVVAAACKAAGIENKFEFYPWPRAENLVLDGKAFGAFPYAKNDERIAKFEYSDPLFRTHSVFAFSTRNKALVGKKFRGWEDVKPYKIAYLAGSWLEKDMKAAGIDVSLVSDIDSAVKMLKVGRVDLLVDDSAVLTSAIKRQFPGDEDEFTLVPSELFGSGGEVYLLVSRSYPNSRVLLDKFNKGLATIAKNGVLDGIAKKYGLMVK